MRLVLSVWSSVLGWLDYGRWRGWKYSVHQPLCGFTSNLKVEWMLHGFFPFRKVWGSAAPRWSLCLQQSKLNEHSWAGPPMSRSGQVANFCCEETSKSPVFFVGDHVFFFCTFFEEFSSALFNNTSIWALFVSDISRVNFISIWQDFMSSRTWVRWLHLGELLGLVFHHWTIFFGAWDDGSCDGHFPWSWVIGAAFSTWKPVDFLFCRTLAASMAFAASQIWAWSRKKWSSQQSQVSLTSRASRGGLLVLEFVEISWNLEIIWLKIRWYPENEGLESYNSSENALHLKFSQSE